MEVTLLPVSEKEVIDKLYLACRTCYNAGTPNDMYKLLLEEQYAGIDRKDAKLKLLKHVINSGHHSTLEHQQLTFLISGVSRALTHQLVRHRICNYCVAGDTVLKQRSHGENRTIKELYESTKQYNDMRRIRCVNEKTRELQYDPIKEVVYSGVKPVYEVVTEFGYKIKTTMQHKFFTTDGWKTLSEISVGDSVYVNGIPAYKDREWLEEQYHALNKSQEEIGIECGVSKHTIQKWIRYYNLQKPMGSWTIGVPPVNKGRTKYDYEPLQMVSQKMQGNKNGRYAFGPGHHSWKGDDITIGGGYGRMHRNFVHVGKCSNCGKKGATELHHLDKNPKNNRPSNIRELCRTCHRAMHGKESKSVIIPNKVVSISYVGEVDTYDICMAGDNHNFIANGFVVHNSQQSQRYVELKDGVFEYVTPSKIKHNEEALKVFEDTMGTLGEAYKKLIDLGMPAEDARAVLPNACTTNLTWSCNLRELMHICNERLCTCAQQEIRQLFMEIKKQTVAQLPFMNPYLVPKCEMLGYCNEDSKRSCGRKYTKEVVFGSMEVYS